MTDEKVSERLAPKATVQEGRMATTSFRDIEFRMFAVRKATKVVEADILNIPTAKLGDHVVSIASKIEEYIKSGKKEEDK